MFDRLCALLLRCYPAGFRRAYGQEALQLIKDRARHERGPLLRTRLLFDLALDVLATSLTWQSAPRVAVARVDGGPRLDILEHHRPRPQALAAGMLTSMMMFATFTLLFEARPIPEPAPQLGQGTGGDPDASALNIADANQAASADDDPAATGDGGGVSLITVVAANLQQRYFDKEIGQQLASTLLAYDKAGRYNSADTWESLAERVTADIYDRGREIGIAPGAFVADVIYTGGAAPLKGGESNCAFEAIESLPGDIGYMKLNAFAHPDACLPAATRAMTTLNRTDALIIDLRDNGGGMGETALHIAGYLFDRPAFFYDPRPHSRVPAHTASPVPGNRLADKPVYVLTSRTTQSAAEYFVYNLKMLKRVTVVGERTGGQQHSGAFYRLSEYIGIGIQETEPPLNPYPIKGWERIGIEPDVKVSKTDAVETAKQLAVTRSRGSGVAGTAPRAR